MPDEQAKKIRDLERDLEQKRTAARGARDQALRLFEQVASLEKQILMIKCHNAEEVKP